MDGESMVRMKLVSWRDQKEMMNHEETDEVVADEKSQEVDFRYEVMHIEKSNKWFLEQRDGWSSWTAGVNINGERVLLQDWREIKSYR